jgi:hypothetical protein
MIDMNARVRAALKKVEQLDLDPADLRALGNEIAARSECKLDLSGVSDTHERTLLHTIKSRIDAHLRGETTPVSMAEAERQVTARLRARRVARSAASRS